MAVAFYDSPTTCLVPSSSLPGPRLDTFTDILVTPNTATETSADHEDWAATSDPMCRRERVPRDGYAVTKGLEGELPFWAVYSILENRDWLRGRQ